MNPLSISLRNFLCYEAQSGGEPYVFDFRDRRLWSICGDNGSGKSAIFDAITYCLYGQHRGGSSRDDELVHRGATEMLACVEFEHGGKQYRVTRTIRLGVRPRKGTPTILRECRMEWLRPDGEWLDVPETSSARGLENAVQRILGFGCETLTASVLLLQGKSDRLIDAGGKERFDILSGILDLSRYERMAERAKDRAKEARARYQAIAHALEEAPPPDEAVVEAAEVAAMNAEHAADTAAAACSDAERTLSATVEYRERVQRLEKMRSEEKQMVQALSDAPRTVAEAKEAEVLELTLPRLGKALRAQTEAAKAVGQAIAARQAAAQVDVAAAEKAVEKTNEEHAASRTRHQEVLKLISDARSALDEIAPQIEAAKELIRLDGQIGATAAEVSKLEERFAGIALIRTKVERLRKLESARGLITNYRKAREAEAIAISGAENQDPDAELLHCRKRREELEVEAKAAASVESNAQSSLAQAETILAVTQSTLRQREDAGAEGTCSHCGQKVSAAHIKKEIAAARAAMKAATSALSTAQRTCTAAKERRRLADEDVAKATKAEAQASDRATLLRRARQELEELEQSPGFGEFPPDVLTLLKSPLTDLQVGIANLVSTQAELPGLERQLTELAGAESAAAAKRELVIGWRNEVAELLTAYTRDQLAAVRQLEVSLQQQLKKLQSDEAERRIAEQVAAGAAVTARETLSDRQRRRRELEEEARLADQRGVGFQQEASGSLTGVAEDFLPVTQTVIDETERRLQQLDGAAERLEILRKAETEVEGLRGQIKEVRALIDVTPETHRIAVDKAKEALTSAQECAIKAHQVARSNRRTADELRKSRQERLSQQVAAQKLATERAIWEKVGQLLGRGGIQTALMRSALEDIRERANVLLSRISGGQLQLDVTFEQTSRGEEIYFSCIDAASSEMPLDVQFLSGGQRFRCAVALAAGIGQRAGSEGAMPSQIIDEGFGSLDTRGRAEMLDEIRQMSEFYERVIVVSHLESFHDQSLFPARFELTKEGTRTVVTMVA